jgi:hypothetical protein
MKLGNWTLAAGFSLALFLNTQPLAAASKTGGDLGNQCQIGNNLAVIVCHIYIHAVEDVLAENTVHGYRACLPEDPDIDQSVSIFVDWIGQHPDEQKDPASDVIAHALSETYRCG